MMLLSVFSYNDKRQDGFSFLLKSVTIFCEISSVKLS